MKSIQACAMLMILAFAAGCSTSTPLQISLWDPVQVFDHDKDVNGVRLNLPYGRNQSMRGIDIGMFNRVDQTMQGIQVAGPVGCNMADRMEGLQFSVSLIQGGILQLPGANVARHMRGIQIGGFGNLIGGTTTNDPSGSAVGIQFAGVGGNLVDGELTGWQTTMIGANHVKGKATGFQLLSAGFNGVKGDMQGIQVVMLGANATKGVLRGLQVGPYNTAENVTGVQLGIINSCLRLHGLQIGLINVSRDHKLPYMPIINARF